MEFGSQTQSLIIRFTLFVTGKNGKATIGTNGSIRIIMRQPIKFVPTSIPSKKLSPQGVGKAAKQSMNTKGPLW